MSLALDMAIDGDLHTVADRYKVAYLTAVKESGTAEAAALQAKLRADVLGAGLGQGVANAWRVTSFPSGTKLAYDPAWIVDSHAARIIDAFDRGAVIEPRKAGGLAVPIPGSPADSLKIRRGGNLVAEAVRKFGPLKAVTTRRGTMMLVAVMRGTAAGTVRTLAIRSTKDGHRFSPVGQRRVEVPLFWIVRQVRLQKRLRSSEISRQAEADFAGRVEARLRTRFAAAETQGVEGTVGAS